MATRADGPGIRRPVAAVGAALATLSVAALMVMITQPTTTAGDAAAITHVPGASERSPRPMTTSEVRSRWYGYTVAVPPGAVASLGSERWTILAPPMAPPAADIITGSDWRLTVVATSPVPGLTSKLFTDVVFTTDPTWAGATCPEVAADPPRWWFTRIGSASGMARVACRHVQAVARAGGRMYALTFDPGTGASDASSTLGRPSAIQAFERTVASIRFDPSAPTPRPSPSPSAPPSTPAPLVRYTSDVNGYSLSYPDQWERSAVEGGRVDRYIAPGGTTLRISSHRLMSGTTAAEWAAARVPDRARSSGTARFCEFRRVGVTIIPGPAGPAFREAELMGRPAAIRGLCGYVDAVIDTGDRVLYLSLKSRKPRPDGDVATFEDLIDRLSLRIS